MIDSTLEKAERAKALLKEQFGDCAWFQKGSVGVSPTPKGYAVRLNVDPDMDFPEADVRASCSDVELVIVRTKGYSPR